MKMRLAALLLLGSALGFAETWSGVLVDSNCYHDDQTNVNKDESTTVRDMNLEVRQCAPNEKTKAFAVVLPDWSSLKLDAPGNAKASAIVQKSEKKSAIEVMVTGDLENNHTIKVVSISAR